MKPKLILHLVASLLIAISFCTCKTSKSKAPVIEEPIVNSPQIIFLNYTIYKKTAQTNQVRFVNKIITTGKLKGQASQAPIYKTGDLKCFQLDKKSNPLDSLYIANPLYKIVEYVDDYGQFSKKEIALDSAQFSIRMQLKPNTAAITVEQLDIEKQVNTNLIITKIK